jgi:ubiquinone/menaquinone biosynthesis C-methylase UbiE
MLREAARHVHSHGRSNVRLWQMDASSLAFSDESFDVVYAAYVVSVVPDPVAVLKEMRRVSAAAGGHIVLLNHFLSTNRSCQRSSDGCRRSPHGPASVRISISTCCSRRPNSSQCQSRK